MDIKVYYFEARGVAEPIRYLLSYIGEEFEDVRLDYAGSNWAEMKPKTPFGKLPMVEIDGEKYTQSQPLYRYLGKKAKLAGDNDIENLQIDIIADVLADLKTAGTGVIFEPDEEVKKTKKSTVINDTLPSTLKKLEDIAKSNGGYLANGKLSWVDFMFASLMENLGLYLGIDADFINEYPTLKALKEKVLSFPRVKAWIEKRPNTQF